jgi:alkanesulfonate monooxygenase SsuD/methylene tetrahydromethanopterin reductase-like flavin-dependent oxidoreductase (luciferase family)
MDEIIAVLKGLLRGGFFRFHGRHFDVESIKMCPTPSRPVPILVGGHSDAALRRAAALGDGWMHAGGGTMEMARMIARLNELRREYGRDKEPFEVHVISSDAYSGDGLRRLEDAGATDVIVGFRKAYEADRMPLEKKLSAIRRYGDSVIARSRGAPGP